MRSPLAQRALTSLAHPIVIGAAIVLLLNALVWQSRSPSWWTGKIGDFAWLVIAPFVILVMVGILAHPIPSRTIAWGTAVIVATGLTFGLVKGWAPVHSLVVTMFGRLGFTPKVLLDPSDLLALPGLIVAWSVWQRPGSIEVGGMFRRGALMLAALALIADSPARQPNRVICLVADEGAVHAYAQSQAANYFGGPILSWAEVYSSRDGGVTWTMTELTSKDERDQKPDCSQVSWPVRVMNAGGSETQLYLLDGQGVYSSEDEGQTLHLEQKVPSIYGAIVDSVTGNLIVAAGTDGAYVRTAKAEWIHAIPTQK
jgi:hypothetical protein